MPQETATYIPQLNAANPAHDDSIGAADTHVRLLKAVLLATLPGFDKPILLTADQINNIPAAIAGAHDDAVQVALGQAEAYADGAQQRAQAVAGQWLQAEVGARNGAIEQSVSPVRTLAQQNATNLAAEVRARGDGIAALSNALAAYAPNTAFSFYYLGGNRYRLTLPGGIQAEMGINIGGSDGNLVPYGVNEHPFASQGFLLVAGNDYGAKIFGGVQFNSTGFYLTCKNPDGSPTSGSFSYLTLGTAAG